MEYRPKNYQRLAHGKILGEGSAGLFLDMGLGKTVITLTAAADLIALDEIRKVLVIAPLNTAQNTWPSEVEKWDHLNGLRVSLILGDVKKRRAAVAADAEVYVVNRENVPWLCEELTDWPFEMIVIDELSSFKNPSAKRFKALRKKIPLAKKVVGLTGTPAPNGYMDLWSEVYLLDRGRRLGQTVGQFRQIYFHPARMNGHVVYEWALNRGAKDAIDKKLADLCISMKAVDLLDMPERVESNVYVSMTDAERRLYVRLGRDHVLPEIKVAGVNAASVRGKLLQMSNGFLYDENRETHHIHDHKIDAVGELVEAAGGRPVLIYYAFLADKKKLLERFPEARTLDGPESVKAWNAGTIPILVAHPASAGHGLNLQDGGNIIIWFGLTDSLELYQQANARLYRQGQKNTVYIYHVMTRGTFDDDVLASLHAKDKTQDSLQQALKARIEKWQTI